MWVFLCHRAFAEQQFNVLDCRFCQPVAFGGYENLLIYHLKQFFKLWSEWRLTVIAATVRIALVDILDLSEVDIPAGGFLYPAVGWG